MILRTTLERQHVAVHRDNPDVWELVRCERGPSCPDEHVYATDDVETVLMACADALAPAPDVDDLAHDAKVQAVHLRLTQRANELHSAHVALEEAAEEIVNLHDELADALAPAAPMRVRVWQQGFDREDQAKVIVERPDGQPFTRAEAQQIAAQVEASLPPPPSPERT